MTSPEQTAQDFDSGRATLHHDSGKGALDHDAKRPHRCRGRVADAKTNVLSVVPLARARPPRERQETARRALRKRPSVRKFMLTLTQNRFTGSL